MFEGFTLERVDVGDAVLRVRHGGAGTPVLLLHGHPRTHTTWHCVAPILTQAHTVVCPDLRGYGESTAPPDEPGHVVYSKRAMARDCAALMRALGHERFAVAGHDRGCYVALRLALDAPERVERLVVMDGVPIAEALDRCDARFAASWWHWFFLGQDDKPAERVINADPDAWYRGDEARMGAENFADWRRAIHDPATVHAMCEDYRAGLTVDRAEEESDRAAGRRVRCPTLFLWSEHDDMEELYGDPLAIWSDWAEELSGARIACGHHMAEEAPEALAAALREFFMPLATRSSA
jgi:haloacetate dehalogenase